MSNYCIYVASPPGFQFSRAVDDVALSLSVALRRLGRGGKVVPTLYDCKGRIPIVLLPNMLPALLPQSRQLPPETILFNLEQVSPESPWFTPGYLQLLHRYQVWDYDQRNIQALHGLGAADVRHCPIGYVPEISRLEKTQEDIDVLFYGAVNARRSHVLDELSRLGARVIAPSNPVFGSVRDALISRSKIVLNVHFYESQVLEMVRISYLLANRKCVVTESVVDDIGDLVEGLASEPYDAVPGRCMDLLASSSEREAIGRRGFGIFSSQKMESILESLV